MAALKHIAAAVIGFGIATVVVIDTAEARRGGPVEAAGPEASLEVVAAASEGSVEAADLLTSVTAAASEDR